MSVSLILKGWYFISCVVVLSGAQTDDHLVSLGFESFAVRQAKAAQYVKENNMWDGTRFTGSAEGFCKGGIVQNDLCFCPLGCEGPACISLPCTGSKCSYHKANHEKFHHGKSCHDCHCNTKTPEMFDPPICPENPLLPKEKFVIIVCCDVGSTKSTDVKTDPRVSRNKEAPWIHTLPYCYVTLKKGKNTGMEATAYLNYLFQSYNNLPERIGFVHGNHGWHDHVHKSNLFAANVALPTAPYTPIPGPILQDPDLDLRTVTLLSMQKFYDTMLVNALGFPSKDINGFGQDRLHYCCAQFVIQRDVVLQHPRNSYLALMLYSYIEHDDYRTSREFEHNWQNLFTTSPAIDTEVLTEVNSWRKRGMLGPCSVWNCTCQGLSDMYDMSPGKVGNAHHSAIKWWKDGNYNGVGYYQLYTVSNEHFGLYAFFSMEGRDATTRKCTTYPQLRTRDRDEDRDRDRDRPRDKHRDEDSDRDRHRNIWKRTKN